MTEIVFDIETNGKDPDIIWCIVAKEVGHGEPEIFTGDKIKDFDLWLSEIKDCDTLIGHNILGYDLPVLERLLGMPCRC